jgi:uncharacterized membrane protein
MGSQGMTTSSWAAIKFPTDEVAGLPLHPLVVHAVVVLVPLACLGLIVMATSGARSKRYGPAVIFVGTVAALAAWFARYTGEEFRAHLGMQGSKHFQYGDYEPWAALAVLGFIVVLAIMDQQGGGRRNAVGSIVALVGVVLAVATTGLTVVTGYTGAQLVWG